MLSTMPRSLFDFCNFPGMLLVIEILSGSTCDITACQNPFKFWNACALKRVSHPVKVELEITEIADRITKGDGPVLLFKNVAGKNTPLLINAFGPLDLID